jgi:hypothetical protein
MPLAPARARQGRARRARHAPRGRKPASAGWRGQACCKRANTGLAKPGCGAQAPGPGPLSPRRQGMISRAMQTDQRGVSTLVTPDKSDLGSGQSEVLRPEHKPLMRWQRGTG